MKRSAFFALSFLAIVSPALAEDAPDYAAATLSGDWNGTRSDLWRRGIALDAGIHLDSLHNRGGARDGTERRIKRQADRHAPGHRAVVQKSALAGRQLLIVASPSYLI